MPRAFGQHEGNVTFVVCLHAVRENHLPFAATIHGQTTKGSCGVLTCVRLFARVEAACCAIVGDRDIAIEFDTPDNQRELPFVDGFRQQIRVLPAWIGEGSRLGTLYTINVPATTRPDEFPRSAFSLLTTLFNAICAPCEVTAQKFFQMI